MDASGRDRRRNFVLLPVLVVAVAVLAYFTFRTTLQLDRLRQESVLEATFGLANEKAVRLDRQIIDQDNVAIALVDPNKLVDLPERWLPTAQRETPSVRAIVVLDDQSRVLTFASRSTGAFSEEETFRRTLVNRIVPELALSEQPEGELRHLHRQYDKQNYLLSYWQRTFQGRRYVVVAWHDIGRIVRETLPTLYAEGRANATTGKPEPASAQSRMNVIDEEGRIIFGPPLRSGEFTVAVRIPTTLYNWRLQVSPAASEELAVRVQNRRLLEMAMVALSCLVIVAGVATILLAAERDRRVSALKSEFVANVSHELKTPLALVRMFAEMLQTGRVASDAKRVEYLDIIVRESDRLSSLIENVLDFAKVERRGKNAYELALGDVGDAVTHAVNVYRYRVEKEGATIELDIEPGLPLCEIDDRAIQLAVINLVDNALKYAPGSAINVSAHAHGADGFVAISVRDRGPGVPEEERGRIFERFVRGESRGGSQVRGSGIGLALVAHIATSHGGKAWVESPNSTDGLPSLAETGSTFVFTIRAARSSKPFRSDGRAATAPTLGGTRGDVDTASEISD